MDLIKGTVYKFGDNVNTDYIISGRYKFSITDINELSKHVFEDLNPNFYNEMKKGETIVVAGSNFGLGSSREQAPLVIKGAGISAVIAKSFARIFFRNAFNIGLLLIEADTDKINHNEKLEIDLAKGVINNLSKNEKIKITPLPSFMQKFLADGGVINHYKKHGKIEL